MQLHEAMVIVKMSVTERISKNCVAVLLVSSSGRNNEPSVCIAKPT
jgi:hypothetical protein